MENLSLAVWQNVTVKNSPYLSIICESENEKKLYNLFYNKKDNNFKSPDNENVNAEFKLTSKGNKYITFNNDGLKINCFLNKFKGVDDKSPDFWGKYTVKPENSDNSKNSKNSESPDDLPF